MRAKLGSPMVLLRTMLVAGLLGGCVYYNGMYNANRLANSARKAEREGRTFEARSLWGQVATKAESVVVRHPKSKYAEEAAILRGLALGRMGQCEQALAPLGRVAVAAVSTDLTEEARLAMGRCYVALGNMTAADAAFTYVVDSKDDDRRREARFQRARTLRHAGRYDEALAALEGIEDDRVVPELLISLAGAGRVPESMRIADSLIAQGDTTQPWDTLVVTLARQDPLRGSRLVDRLRRLPNRNNQTHARWLLEDGARLVRADPKRAAARFREAVKLGGTEREAGQASLQLIRLELQGVRHPHELSALTQTLGVVAQNRNVASEATSLRSTVTRILATLGSLKPGSPQGDLRLFLAAETARDSLVAPRLAEELFLRIPEGWPGSPYAPKAILAAQQLNPTWADSARALLETRYFDSPYLAVIRGEDASAYRRLEDSLGAFAAASAPPVRRAPSEGPGRRTPPARGDAERPGRRLPQPAPSVRVVEP